VVYIALKQIEDSSAPKTIFMEGIKCIRYLNTLNKTKEREACGNELPENGKREAPGSDARAIQQHR
jgi:hypothetical protein